MGAGVNIGLKTIKAVENEYSGRYEILPGRREVMITDLGVRLIPCSPGMLTL